MGSKKVFIIYVLGIMWNLLYITTLLFTIQKTNENIVMHKIHRGKCGEVSLPSRIVPFAARFGGLKPRGCASCGYHTYFGTETVAMGPFGEKEVCLYVRGKCIINETDTTAVENR